MQLCVAAVGFLLSHYIVRIVFECDCSENFAHSVVVCRWLNRLNPGLFRRLAGVGSPAVAKRPNRFLWSDRLLSDVVWILFCLMLHWCRPSRTIILNSIYARRYPCQLPTHKHDDFRACTGIWWRVCSPARVFESVKVPRINAGTGTNTTTTTNKSNNNNNNCNSIKYARNWAE